jgi:hypothetical protein
MRFLSLGAFTLVILGTPALALNGGDPMQAWARASAAEKGDLLKKLDAAGGERVRSCLDDTAKTAGHSALSISEVAKACSEQAAKDNI